MLKYRMTYIGPYIGPYIVQCTLYEFMHRLFHTYNLDQNSLSMNNRSLQVTQES